MKSHTVYKTFRIPERRAFVRITEDVQEAVDESGIREGMALVAAMHITAGCVGQRRRARASRLTRSSGWTSWRRRRGSRRPTTWPGSCCPTAATTATTAAARTTATPTSKNLLVHHQVIVPVTDGRLDLGPWQAVFYCEFDGRRGKRLIIKVIGE